MSPTRGALVDKYYIRGNFTRSTLTQNTEGKIVMIPYQKIIDTAERKIQYPYKFVALPALTQASSGTEELQTWQEENWWMVNYQVTPENLAEAKELALKLHYMFQANQVDTRIPALVARLREMKAKDPGTFTAHDQWQWGAIQLVNYAGDQEEWEVIIAALENYQGNILEAMCGHHSYFRESSKRIITALDYSEESLKRYSHREAERFCCDLNLLKEYGRLDFLEEESFDVISVCFGYKYPDDILGVAREFKRLLKPRGKLSFVESPGHGYREYCKRDLNPETVVHELLEAGFSTACSHTLAIESEWVTTAIYHIEAIR